MRIFFVIGDSANQGVHILKKREAPLLGRGRDQSEDLGRGRREKMEEKKKKKKKKRKKERKKAKEKKKEKKLRVCHEAFCQV